MALKLLEEHLESFFGRPEGNDLTTCVRHAVSIAVATRHELPSEGAVAKNLGMTARTLRRGFSVEGGRFRAIAEDVLARHARRQLQESALPVSGIAERLGYAESASFVRAFRRWTGETPQAYRKRVRGG